MAAVAIAAVPRRGARSASFTTGAIAAGDTVAFSTMIAALLAAEGAPLSDLRTHLTAVSGVAGANDAAKNIAAYALLAAAGTKVSFTSDTGSAQPYLTYTGLTFTAATAIATNGILRVEMGATISE